MTAQALVLNMTHNSLRQKIKHKTQPLTDLGSVSAGQVVQRELDGVGGVGQHAAGDGGLGHVDHEEVHGRLGRAHLLNSVWEMTNRST